MQDERIRKSTGDGEWSPHLEDFALFSDLTPSSPSRYSDLRLSAGFLRTPAASFRHLQFCFHLRGAPSSLRLPFSYSELRGVRRDELWKTTCFEFFLSLPGSKSYFEFNFAPGGDWAVYRFQDYRTCMASVQPLAPPVTIDVRTESAFTLFGAIGQAGDDAALESLLRAPNIEVAATAVLQFSAFDAQRSADSRGPARGFSDEAGAQLDGTSEYWALRHAGEKADFHLRSSFTLSL